MRTLHPHRWRVLSPYLFGQGKLAAAHAALSLAIEHLTPTLGADHPGTRLAARLVAGSATP